MRYLQLFFFSLFFTRSPFFFCFLILNLHAHSEFSFLTFFLFLVEVTTLIEATSISVYLMTWTSYESWHYVYLSQLICHLSTESFHRKTFCLFTSNMFPNLLIIRLWGFHSARTTTISLVFQTLNSVVIVDMSFFLIYLSPRYNIFQFKNDSQVFTSLFIFPFIVLAHSFSISQ